MTEIKKIEIKSDEELFYESFLNLLNSSQDWKLLLLKINSWEKLTEIEEYLLIWIVNSLKKEIPSITIVSNDMILSILNWLKEYNNSGKGLLENSKRFISSLLCTAFLLDTKHI